MIGQEKCLRAFQGSCKEANISTKRVLLFDRNNFRNPQPSVKNSSGSDKAIQAEEENNCLRLVAFYPDNFLHVFAILCVLLQQNKACMVRVLFLTNNILVKISIVPRDNVTTAEHVISDGVSLYKPSMYFASQIDFKLGKHLLWPVKLTFMSATLIEIPF